MRFTIIALFLALAPSVHASPALNLHWQADGQRRSVSPIEMQFDDTAIALDEVLNPFTITRDKFVTGICFKGDVNQVCSLLSSMSKLSAQRYAGGDHGVAKLKGCRILGRGKPVQAIVELFDDYSDASRKATATIEACAN